MSFSRIAASLTSYLCAKHTGKEVNILLAHPYCQLDVLDPTPDDDDRGVQDDKASFKDSLFPDVSGFALHAGTEAELNEIGVFQ